MFIRSSFELKVGIFIFIGIVILSVIIFSVGNFYSIKQGYTLSVIFGFANGIGVGAPVRYAGVEVGAVRNIKIYFDETEDKPLVNLYIWVAQNTWINKDAKATINTLGLLGEKYLEIRPGTKETALLKRGDILRGQDPVSTEEFTRDTKKTIAKLDMMIGSLNKIVGDEELRSSIKGTITNLEKLTFDLREVVALLKSDKGTIGRFMTDDKLYKDINDMILDIKKNPWKLLYRPKESRRKKR